LRMEPTVHQLFDLSGRTVLLTGGAGHLGSAMARALAEAGAPVVLTSRDAGRARSQAASLPGPAQHHGIALDHMDPLSLESGFREAVELGGKVDILINNGNEPVGADWTDVTAEQFNRQLANATGYFLLSRLFREHVVARGRGGCIVMLGSMYGQVASYPDAYEGVCAASPVGYHALKGGIIHMTRHLAAYWAADGIRVNCLSPGPFPSETAPPKMVERLCQKLPMRRMGEAWELKGALVFLCSDASTFMTGQNLTIDGGWTAW
jgi:NAD(P)-dependent dehydrogenase (short-subunit alcohol dehydrogenase family)